jgi:hypothetical protein
MLYDSYRIPWMGDRRVTRPVLHRRIADIHSALLVGPKEMFCPDTAPAQTIWADSPAHACLEQSLEAVHERSCNSAL